MVDTICVAKTLNPDLKRVTVSKKQHEQLCQELTQREGTPTRVYCIAGIKVQVA